MKSNMKSNIYLILNNENSSNVSNTSSVNTFGSLLCSTQIAKEFKERVIPIELQTPPDEFLPKFHSDERKRIYTHLSIWKKKQNAIILEDHTYTNLEDQELFSYLYFERSNSLVELNQPEIYFYGKYNSACLSHRKVHCDEVEICNRILYKTDSCAGAYAYMINSAACDFLVNYFNCNIKSNKSLDLQFQKLTQENKIIAYTYHPSIIKSTLHNEYECLNPIEEVKLKEKKCEESWFHWFIFLCLLLLIFLIGLALYYVYRIGMTRKYNKTISTGYYEEFLSC